MRATIKYFLDNPLAGNLLMFSILIFGLFGLFQMQSTFFPETPSRLLAIQVVYPGSSPEEIEDGIILKIEENLRGLTGVERVTSVSRENGGSLTVEVQQGYDPDLILTDVKNAVDQISSFPAGMEPPTVYKLEGLNFAINFALTGNLDLKTLKSFGRKAEDELRDINGISKVSLSGFPEEEIEIAFREDQLNAFNLTFAEATAAVQRANLEITGGNVKSPAEEFIVRARSKNYYADELKKIVLKTSASGTAIRLGDVAAVRDQWVDNPARTFVNGKEAVIVSVQNTNEEDLLFITDKVKEYVEDYNVKNTNIKATIIRDSSITLQQRIDLLTKNGVIGFILVVLILAMFLHWRLAFWVGIAIPISIMGMFMLGNFLGVTINVISLFGMIIVIGILVDDGIVIAESIYQKYEAGENRMDAAINGTMDVLPAVCSAITTTVIAFSTFFFIEGALGDIFYQMAIVVIVTLVFSLIEGALILPAHVAHSKALSPDRKTPWIQKQLDNVMNFLKNKIYSPILKFCLENVAVAIVLPVGLMVLTISAIQGGMIRTTFFPVIERNDVDISLEMPAGSREAETLKWLDKMEKIAWEVNRDFGDKYFNGDTLPILKIQKNIGSSGGGGGGGPNQAVVSGGSSGYKGNLSIALIDGETRDTVTANMISSEIRKRVGPISEAENTTYGISSVFGKPVSISLLGNNYEELENAIKDFKTELAKEPDLRDILDNNQQGLREINISLKDKAYLLGLNLQQVLGQVRSAFFGSEVQRLQRGRDEVRVWVRLDAKERASLTNLENLRIRTAAGQSIPLHEVANFKMERGVTAINHLDGKREVKVEADVKNAKVSVSDITNKVKTEIGPAILKKYPNVKVLYEGQNREQERSASSMQRTMPVILFLMFLVIALTFRSLSQTVVVFALIPFGFIGVGWGHYIFDTPINLFSMLGIIALVGILVNDALVFVAAFNQNIKSGQSHWDALYNAGVSRFRPIVLTSVTTVAGLGPLILEKSFQAQFLVPMAISIAFGLVVVTFIILILLPSLLMLVNRFKVYSIYLWSGEKPGYETVEPAYPIDEAKWELNKESLLPEQKPHRSYGIWVLVLALLVLAIYFLQSLAGFFMG